MLDIKQFTRLPGLHGMAVVLCGVAFGSARADVSAISGVHVDAPDSAATDSAQGSSAQIETSPDLTFRPALIEAAVMAIPDDPGPVEVSVGLQIHYRYTVSVAPDAPDPTDDPSIGFGFRRLRPSFEFETFDGKFSVMAKGEGSNDQLELIDIIATVSPNDNWRFRFGRFVLSFARESMVSSKRQLAADRGSLTNNVLPGDGMRVNGFETRYSDGPCRLYFTLSEGTGTTITSYNDRRPEWGVTLRGERLLIGESFRPFRRFSAPRETPVGLLAGLAGHVQHLGDDGMGAGQGTRWAATADLGYQHDGFSAAVAGMMRGAEDRNERSSVEPENLYGFTAQTGLYVSEAVELFARYEWGTTSDETHPDLHHATAGWNWYIAGEALKFTTDFSVAFDGVGPAFDRSSDGLLRTPEGDNRYVFRSQIIMVF